MRIAIALYALAVLVRLALVILYPDPAYPDAFYYTDVARAIHAGQGLNVDFIWIFAEVGGRIPAVPTLPIPANGHWMPLASFVQVPFLFVLGTAPWVSALPFALIGALAAPLTWAIAREAGARPIVAVGAGLLVAVPALTTAFMPQPDNFSLYQPLVAGALWMTARGLKGSGRSFALAGLLVGLATLARNDGLLVGFVVGFAFLWDRWRAWRSGGARSPQIPFGAAVACVALFLVATVPWWLRQLAVFGTLSPSTASGRVLFIQNIGEWDSITGPVNLAHLLAQGWGPLLLSRVLGLVAAIGIFSILVGAVFLVPFIVVGAWTRRRSVDFGPFLAYAGVLFAFSAIVSAVHVPGGTFIHSAVALAPHSYILALEGVAVVVAWVARRRPRWDVERATRVFAGGVVVLAMATGGAYVGAVHAGWDQVRQQRLAVAAALDRLGVPVTDRLMSIDAAGYRYYTGRGGVVLVNDPPDTIHAVASAYGIRWLILERADSVTSMEPVLAGTTSFPWIGRPVFTVPSSDGSAVPVVAVFPVCTVAGDARCPAPVAGVARP